MTPTNKYTRETEIRPIVFISYSRKDSSFVDQLEATLKARDFEPLVDRREIEAFEDWWKRVQALIGRADVVVFVLSPDAVASDVALREMTYAAELNKRIAPIVCRPVDLNKVPDSIRRLHFVFFDSADRFDASMDQLAEAIRTDIKWIRKHSDYGIAARLWSSADSASGLLMRSPALEDAERWIAARPPGAPQTASEVQTFIFESRRGATRRRNLLTGSLAAGLFIALGLVGLAYWQRHVAVEAQSLAETERKIADKERGVADEQRKLAENQQRIAEAQRLAAERETARSLIREARLFANEENYGASLTATLKAFELAGSNLDASTKKETIRALYQATLNTREKFVLSTDSDAFDSVSFSPKGGFILTISQEPTARGRLLRLWETETGKLFQEYELDTIYRADLKLSADGKHLAVYNAVSIFVFEVLEANIKFLASIRPPNATTFLDYSRNGKFLITGSLDGQLRIRDPRTLAVIENYDLGTQEIVHADLSSDKLVVFTSGSGGAVYYAGFPKVGPVPKAKALGCLSFKSYLGIFKSYWSPGHFYIPCGFIYSLLDPKTGVSQPFKLSELQDFVGGGLAVSAASQIDNDDIALLSVEDGAIYLFSNGVLKHKLASHPRATFLSKGVEQREAGTRMFASASGDYTARLWEERRDSPIASLAGHTNVVQSATLSRGGKDILTAGGDRTARLWSAWPQIVSFNNDQEVTHDCNRKIVRDGQELNIRKDYNDFRIYAGQTEIRRFRPPDGGAMQAFCVSPKGDYLLMGTQNGMFELVEIGSWEQVAKFDLSGIAYGGNTLKTLELTEDGKNYRAFFGNVAARWAILESIDDLLAYAKSILPRTPSTDGAARTKINLDRSR